MGDLLSAMKDVGLINQKTEDWARRRQRKRERIAENLVKSDKVDPKKAKELAREIDEAEIERKRRERSSGKKSKPEGVGSGVRADSRKRVRKNRAGKKVSGRVGDQPKRKKRPPKKNVRNQSA